MEKQENIKVVDLVGCPDCGRSYLQKNIYRHLWDQHNWSREECKQLVALIKSEKKVLSGTTGGSGFTCSSCGVNLKNLQVLIKHKTKCQSEHPVDPNDVESEEDEDEEEDEDDGSGSADGKTDGLEEAIPAKLAKFSRDGKVPKDKQAINDMTMKMLLSSSRYRTSTTVCPVAECKVKVDSHDELVAHCAEMHQTETQKFELEQRMFPDYDSFKKWFDQRQEDSCTSLTKRTGHGGECFYRCHMIGKYSSVAKKRKSNPRKIDQTCTAFLKVFQHKDGTTYAIGCFTHIGHELNHKLLWLTGTQENYVKELIDLGWSSDQIFYYIRQEYDDYECKLKYISKNDIRNITVRHNRARYGLKNDANPMNIQKRKPSSTEERYDDDERETSSRSPDPSSSIDQENGRHNKRNQMMGGSLDDEERDVLRKYFRGMDGVAPTESARTSAAGISAYNISHQKGATGGETSAENEDILEEDDVDVTGVDEEETTTTTTKRLIGVRETSTRDLKSSTRPIEARTGMGISMKSTTTSPVKNPSPVKRTMGLEHREDSVVHHGDTIEFICEEVVSYSGTSAPPPPVNLANGIPDDGEDVVHRTGYLTVQRRPIGPIANIRSHIVLKEPSSTSATGTGKRVGNETREVEDEESEEVLKEEIVEEMES